MSTQKVWLISGASRGIGLAIARRAIDAGDKVALLARGDSVIAAARDLGENAMPVQADVADTASVQAAVDAVLSQWGQLDVVVNNAGLHRGGKVGRLAMEDWQAVLDTNLTGALNVISSARPHLGDGAAIVR